MEHQKFFRGDIESVKLELQREQEEEPKILPYHIIFSRAHPRQALICYNRKEQFLSESVTIDSLGYYFHEALFMSFNEVIKYLKENINDKHYIDYLKSKTKKVEIIIDSDDDDVAPNDLARSIDIRILYFFCPKLRNPQEQIFSQISS